MRCLTAIRLTRAIICLSWLIAFASGACVAQDQHFLCSDGAGSFNTEFPANGLSIRVGALKAGQLATRACAADFAWKKHSLSVVTNAAQIDLDSFGIDLGLRAPVSTLAIRKSSADCCVEYRVYSLTTPPRLLRTITGGGYFIAADTDLDGHVEIWTSDAAAINGFAGLTSADVETAPTMVLRFNHNKLLDVSAEFQSYFDNQIASLRAEVTDSDLRQFKLSDGKRLPDSSLPFQKQQSLRSTRAKVLQIV